MRRINTYIVFADSNIDVHFTENCKDIVRHEWFRQTCWDGYRNNKSKQYQQIVVENVER